MPRTSPYILTTVALLAALGFQVANDPTQPSKPRLFGARSAIDAANFPTLQAALDALPDDGGIVRLPPGLFEIEQPLRLSAEDVTIEGAGTATHIKNNNQQGKPAFIIEPPANKKSIWRIRLANFRITGNPASGDGIVARSVDEVFIDGLTTSYHGGHGIFLDGCYEDPRICDSLITYNKKTGLALVGCHDIIVSSNQFEENLDALTCVDGFNLCMTGNNLDDHLRHGVVIENTYGSVVAGNMIEECQGTAIVLDRDCYGITLSANVIAHDSGGGIDLRDAHGCTVSANTFTIVPQRAVTIGPDSGRITVSANNFSDSYIGDAEKREVNDQAASGIVLNGTSDIAISGNLFSGLDGEAVVIDGTGAARVLFGSSVIKEAGDVPRDLPAEHVTDNLVNAENR
jgi:hypothetical protein